MVKIFKFVCFIFLAYNSIISLAFCQTLTINNRNDDIFLKDKSYALSDMALNATMDLLKHTVPEQKFKEIQQSQEEWMIDGRVSDANRFIMHRYPTPVAYAKSNSDRMKKLVEEFGQYKNLTSDSIPAGDYEYISDKGRIMIRVNDNSNYEKIQVFGETNETQGPICKFEGYFPMYTNVERFYPREEYEYVGYLTTVGRPEPRDDPRQVIPEFFILPTKTGVEVAYLGSGIEQGCAPGVEFNGFYKLVSRNIGKMQVTAPSGDVSLTSSQGMYGTMRNNKALTQGKIKLTDKLHNQFISEDNDYALADAMLNATWKMVKKNLDKSAFASVQKDQREWASSKRDEQAASYAASIPPSQAYTKVMQERIAELASLVAKEPRLGDYEGERQMFNIYKDKGEYQIDGSADNEAGNTCIFEGKLTRDNGWYKVHEDGMPPYFILFTDNGAFIQYIGSGSEHGCGANVGFNGEYKFVK